MPENEAELQASAANLSPVSPAPVHTASPLVVPALQDTVDTIDAMVAAAAATNGDVAAVDLKSAQTEARPQPTHDVDVDAVDDDDPYGEEDAAQPVEDEQHAEQSDTNDDYAHAFDSPVNSEPEAADATEPPATSEDPKPSMPEPSPVHHDAAAPVVQPITEPERPDRKSVV